jgi:hypothetical protein
MYWIDVAKDWQTLITGVLAIIAAVIAYLGAKAQAQAALKATELSIKNQLEANQKTEDRRRSAFWQATIAGLNALQSAIPATRDAVQTKYVMGSHTATVPLPIPAILTSNWEDLALLPVDVQQGTRNLLNLIEQVNENVAIQARNFGGIYEQRIYDQLGVMQEDIKKLLHFLNNLNSVGT